jgi:hypothetical protein
VTDTPVDSGLIQRKQPPLDGARKEQSGGFPISQSELPGLEMLDLRGEWKEKRSTDG